MSEIHKLKKYIDSEYDKFDEETLLSLDEKISKLKAGILKKIWFSEFKNITFST